MENELMSPRDAAKMLNICTDTLRKWEQRGEIVAVKTLGGHRRYYVAQIMSIKGDHDKTSD